MADENMRDSLVEFESLIKFEPHAQVWLLEAG